MTTRLSTGDITNLDKWIEQLFQGILLKESEVKALCEKIKEVFTQEENVVNVRTPITICGDIHGQFQDLMELFKITGKPPNTNFLFLGDYVDRGYYSVETISLIFALKTRYKDRVSILRGNHENKEINQVYGFYDECQKKYGTEVIWQQFSDVFAYIPLAATIDAQVFCLHGGLSPNIQTLDQIRQINRFVFMIKYYYQNIFSKDQKNQLPMKELYVIYYGRTLMNPKKAGVHPHEAQDELLAQTLLRNLSSKIRLLKLQEHINQQWMQGYAHNHNNKVLTLFSAPNYCYRCGNQAAVVEVDETKNFNYIQFEPAPTTSEIPSVTRRVPDYFL